MLCLLGCCRFYDGGSVVVDSLFNVPPIGCVVVISDQYTYFLHTGNP